MEEGISLSALSAQISQGLKQTLQPSYWVVGEISEIQARANGHCYMELIEKPEDEQNPIAKMRATIWANKYRLLAPYFESETGYQLSAGMKILVKAEVAFHALYGFSLVISDIEPTYTIGEDEQRKIKIIRQLEEDGVIDMNKEIPLASVPQRIAVISSDKAAGYQDFMQQLQTNQYNIAFQTTLFPAAMQGVEVESSIVEQLELINQRVNEFDAVVIIRGGGARADLRWFDSYEIASNVAQFPLPVITGIGHDKDQSITDLVAHTSVKTPTAVAVFLIDVCGEFVERLEELQEQILDVFANAIETQNQELRTYETAISQTVHIALLQMENKLESLQQSIAYQATSRLNEARSMLSILQQKITNSVGRQCITEQSRLQLLEAKVLAANPERILKQGYSLTTNESGEILRSKNQLKKNDTITTHFADGTVSSIVK